MKNKVFRKSFLLLFLLASSIVSFVSCSGCSKKSASMAMVPEDATYVVHFDMGRIWDKGDLDHADRYTFIKLLRQEIKDEDSEVAKIFDELLKDPNSCGLNLKGDVLGFMSESMKTEMCIAFQVNNSEKLKDFIKDMSKRLDVDVDFSKESNYNLAYIDNLESAICWDKVRAYFYPAYSEKDANKYADRLMSIDEKNSMSQNDNFNQFMKGQHDLGFFLNSEKAMGTMSRRELEEFGAAADKLKGT